MWVNEKQTDEKDSSQWETCNFWDSPDFMETWDQLAKNLNLSELNCINTKWDVLEVANLLRLMWNKVNEILWEANDLLWPQDKNLRELNRLYAQIRLRAFWLDKIFNPPPRNKLIKFDNSPIIVIYDENNELIFANEAYVKATGLNSLDQIKQLAKDWMLYEAIYDEDTLENVRNRVQTISSTWWYFDQFFQMKNTKRNIKWNTLKNPQHNWSIRIWVDVTNIFNHKNIISSETDNDLSEAKFNFTELFNKYKIKLKEIFEWIPNIKQVFAKVPNINDLNKYFNDMWKLTVIWDMIVNYWSYMIAANDWKESFMNPRYIKATGYTYSQITTLIKEWKLINALYWFAWEDVYVLDRMQWLVPDWHYNDIFTLRRSDLTYIDTEWDSFCFDNIWTSFRIWKIISPTYVPTPSYTYRDVIRLFEEDLSNNVKKKKTK